MDPELTQALVQSIHEAPDEEARQLEALAVTQTNNGAQIADPWTQPDDDHIEPWRDE